MKDRRIVASGITALAAILSIGVTVGLPAHADDTGTMLRDRVDQLRPACGPLGDDPSLRSAAQRHAVDLLRSGAVGHTGSDGSSPQVRIAQAGYSQAAPTGEIVYWGTGSLANPAAALDWWLASPPHRAIIVNCGFTAVGFATADDGNKMVAVGEFGAA